MTFIRKFSQISIDDIAVVGGKNASLGEMFQALVAKGIRVPNGFAITADAYRYYLDQNNLNEIIHTAIDQLDANDLAGLNTIGAKIRQWIIRAHMPENLGSEIKTAYKELAQEYGASPDVAVRSSATAEDLPTASFAGQQETYLNIRGTENLLLTCKRVFASLFTNRAISYRIHQGFDQSAVALSIGVQKMVRSDIGASGVMFTIDTESGFRDVVIINAAFGLGENIVQGTVNPDEYCVFKKTLAQGFHPIITKHLGDKAVKMVYADDAMAGVSTKNLQVQQQDRDRFALSDDEIIELAKYAVTIEQHYSNKLGHHSPMDIEWARDGIDNALYIVQARPETVQSVRKKNQQEIYQLKEKGVIIVSGKSVGRKIACGLARLISNTEHMNDLQTGEILVTDITDPDWEPIMKIAAGIVTNRGGRTCHAAIVARELGIPAVVGCNDATEKIVNGEAVTLSCAEGETGFIYQGKLKFSKEMIELDTIQRPKTKIMINIANPEQAFDVCQIPNDGVGLARLEFIINNYIGIHPRALLEFATLEPKLKQKINKLIAGYDSPTKFYIDKLAEGVAKIAAAFYPKQVIVRLSDFKSNEYRDLLGGNLYEPKEENPMLGFRGAYRYDSRMFSLCFDMELEAMVKVREGMGLKNVALMIPFVRTVDEAKRVLQIMAEDFLRRGEKDLNIYMMCEIPANALLAESFLNYFDGFSIGSNDLTQLTLGVDRDSGLVNSGDERDEAVKKLMQMAIAECKEQHKYVGICGQAPSDFPVITRWLVEQGIDSISLNPDSIIEMTRVVLEMEKELGQ